MDVMTAIFNRRSVRKYLPKPISPDVVQRLHDAMRAAPSASNFQPWHFIFIHDKATRESVARASNGQIWMAEAPIIVVACGMAEFAYKRMGGYGNSADIDVAIAVDHLTLAAVAEGLGTCWVGAFDETVVKRLVNVPPRVKIIVLTPLGYPATEELIHPLEDGRRKSDGEIFSFDSYGVR
ncbi:MAG: nitroreductase family protein [Planctomycetaceae bacterium]|nr:nitroreductase family protein [Planctomycetaceae bacterium]